MARSRRRGVPALLVLCAILLAACSLHAFPKPTPNELAGDRLMALPPVRTIHEANGLLADINAATDELVLDAVMARLFAFLDENGAQPGATVLAGSGVSHFDRRFLRHLAPELDSFLRHWMIDIGVVRRAHEMWVGDLPSAINESKTHRSLDDVYCHLEEARAFASLWQSPGAPKR